MRWRVFDGVLLGLNKIKTGVIFVTAKNQHVSTDDYDTSHVYYPSIWRVFWIYLYHDISINRDLIALCLLFYIINTASVHWPLCSPKHQFYHNTGTITNQFKARYPGLSTLKPAQPGSATRALYYKNVSQFFFQENLNQTHLLRATLIGLKLVIAYIASKICIHSANLNTKH